MAGRRYPVRSRVFHAICREPDPGELTTEYYESEWWDQHLAADERFFSRLPALFSFEGRSVLDFGCGTGQTCVIAAQRGARRVLGVDLAEVGFAESQLQSRYGELADRVEFRQIASAADVGEERFDLVLSKNTFEHVDDPEQYVADMKSLMAPDGELVIGFNPLWKSPYGGHLNFMTRVPWVHLMFPEEVILRERRRFRPDEDPSRYEEIKGGLNRMTLGRFKSVMEASGLEPAYFEVNRNDRRIARALNAFAGLPRVGEYFQFSVHSIWRAPTAS